MKDFVRLCESIRFSGDPACASQSANVERLAGEYAARMRSEGLRVNKALVPEVFRSVEKASEALHLPAMPEVFVVNDPRPNAVAPVFGTGQVPIMVLNSGIVELMGPAELQFVIGHELGHLGLCHAPELADESRPSNYEALRQRSLQRCAEVSADRVGMVAVRSLLTCATVMVKLISGLSSRHLKLDVGAFLDQIRTTGSGHDRSWELFATHPSVPLRLRALIAFAESDAYAQLSGTGSSGRKLSEVDSQIQSMLDGLGDGLLSDMESKKIDLAAVWLSASLAMQDGVVTGQEQQAMISLVGKELARKALRFGKDHGFEAVQSKLSETLNDLAAAGPKVMRRLVEVFKSFASLLGLKPEQTAAWQVLPESLKNKMAEIGIK